MSVGTQLWVLSALFFIAFLLVSSCGALLGNVGFEERAGILIISSLQSIVVFMLPAYAVARMQGAHQSNKLLGLSTAPTLKNIVGILLLLMVAMPALNQVIYWNENMHLPSQLSGIEEQLRNWENSSLKITETILNTTGLNGLFSGILVVGCITGLGEEMFFRAGLQRILSQKLSKHVSIWISAFIFSLLHFQFFGFIPRMLLGAIFGYLYVWTGSIWVAAIAHAINNSIVVVQSWLTASGYMIFSVENIGVVDNGVPWIAVISALVTTFILVFFSGNLFHRIKPKSNKQTNLQ